MKGRWIDRSAEMERRVHTNAQSTHSRLSEERLTKQLKKERSAKLIDSAVEQAACVLVHAHFLVALVSCFRVVESFYSLCFDKRGSEIDKDNYAKIKRKFNK